MRASSITLDNWGNLAQEWRDTYKQSTKPLAEDSGLPWKTIDEHHLDSLKQLLVVWQLEGLRTSEEIRALSLIWHKLNPWPDSSPGIKELNKLFWTVTLSNGNLVFSAELFGSYKPPPKVYLGAVEKLGLKPSECPMVASDLSDLKAAKSNGLQAIYVEMPSEEDWSGELVENTRTESWVDLWIPAGQEGFVTIAERLGLRSIKE